MITKAYHYKQKTLYNRRKQRQNDEQMHRYNKFFVVNLGTGRQTTAITLSRGRIAIGDDVWRMSNKFDTCEYPYKIVNSSELDMFYKKISPANYPLPYYEEVI